MKQKIKDFLHSDASGGILILIATVCALVIANSALSDFYNTVLKTYARVEVGDFGIAKPIILWVNDGLMALFFLLVGLELKREMIEGALADKSKIVMPAIGAIGGMVLPAVIYLIVTWGDNIAMNGWAIPAATDIAFALGLLAILGSRVPVELKLFLMALAILDDIGAIIIIALFYTSDISLLSMGFAALSIAVLAYMNYKKVEDLSPYMIVGVILWISVLKSGVHATLAGVTIAMFIPLAKNSDGVSLLKKLEHSLHPWSTYFILPIFAFANAGVSVSGVSMETILSPIPLGIILGLFLGKQFGVFGAIWISVKMGWAKLPEALNWRHIYGAAILCGIGFTMSLFIGSLAFDEHLNINYAINDKIGILIGSFLSAVFGYIVLKKAIK